MNASVRLRVEIGIGKTETQGLEKEEAGRCSLLKTEGMPDETSV